jgi:hypothetical protein
MRLLPLAALRRDREQVQTGKERRAVIVQLSEERADTYLLLRFKTKFFCQSKLA